MGDVIYPAIGTVDDLEAWIPDLPSGNKDEPLLTNLLLASSQALQDAVGRSMSGVMSYTEVRTLPLSHRFSLRIQPAVSLTSVAFVPTDITGYSPPITVSPTPNDSYAYLLDGQVMVPRWVSQKSRLVVTYTAGFTSTPQDFYQAILELAALRYKDRTHIGQNSKTINGETVAYETKQWNNFIRSVVARYQVKVYS